MILRAVSSFLFIIISVLGNAQDIEIKAITFNIRFDNPSDGNNRWELRKKAAANFLLYENADFVGLQEALLSQIQYLDHELNNMDWIGVGRDNGKEAGEFSPLFYDSKKWKLLKDSTFWLSKTPEKPSKSWDAALPRICTYGIFVNNISNDTVFVFNTHYDHVGNIARVNSSIIISEHIQRVSNNQRSILLGDFNAIPDSEITKTIKEKGLLDSFIQAEIKYGEVGTFTGFDINKIPERRIDYIFHSDDLKVKKYSTDSRVIQGRYLSDHFPVIVSFYLNDL